MWTLAVILVSDFVVVVAVVVPSWLYSNHQHIWFRSCPNLTLFTRPPWLVKELPQNWRHSHDHHGWLRSCPKTDAIHTTIMAVYWSSCPSCLYSNHQHSWLRSYPKTDVIHTTTMAVYRAAQNWRHSHDHLGCLLSCPKLTSLKSPAQLFIELLHSDVTHMASIHPRIERRV